ncbi:pyridoxamine 5'-phosphate oxidase [Streptomyces sp. NRRL S-337]|uniref:pyridoxamine 5'-phosphate oxidase n=1 Tax=Streptomyces sp. NRRL S-337 TaxID=1463900 RepID=UPI001F1AEAFE|nr:pyridoxamine 5'-phosphate oxidase [Streptomyces sp. NRRL S-337]
MRGGESVHGGAAAASFPPCPHAIQQALAAHTTITLAYVDEGGPQACAVLYATDTAAAPAAPDATDVTGATNADHAGQAAGGADGADGVDGADVVEAAEEAAEGAEAVAGAVGGPVLYFVTSTTTRHGRALADPEARVAFTVQRDGQEWSALTGIQGRGRCRPLSSAERDVGWRAYTRRFPFVEADERLRAALERTTLWELRPDWLRLIDNGQGFGHKEEWPRPEGA